MPPVAARAARSSVAVLAAAPTATRVSVIDAVGVADEGATRGAVATITHADVLRRNDRAIDRRPGCVGRERQVSRRHRIALTILRGDLVVVLGIGRQTG